MENRAHILAQHVCDTRKIMGDAHLDIGIWPPFSEEEVRDAKKEVFICTECGFWRDMNTRRVDSRGLSYCDSCYHGHPWWQGEPCSNGKTLPPKW